MKDDRAAENGQKVSPDGGVVVGAVDHVVSTTEWTRVRQIGTVAYTEYRLALRNRWALALTGLFTLFGLMLATFSGSPASPHGMERIVASFANLATYLVPLAALVFGYDAIVGRDKEGWLSVLFALPVTRARVVIGTYVGRLIVLGGSIVLGFGVVGGLLLREFGAGQWDAFLGFLEATLLVGAAFLAIALCVSTLAGEKAHALGLALIVWVWFALIHDLLALGVVSAFALPEAALTALILANPASSFRVLVLAQLGAGGTGGLAAALTSTGLSAPVLTAGLIGWSVIPVGVAAVVIRRRH